MKEKTLKKIFYYCLIQFFLGIILFTVYHSIYDYNTVHEDAVSTLSNTYPFYLVFLIAVFVGPVREEIAFRLWVIEKRWAFWISSVLIVVLGWLQDNHLVIVVGIGLLLYLAFEKKLKLTKAKGTVFFVLSSLTFALLHLNHNNPLIYSFIEILYYSGAGGLLAYIGLRYGFRYSILSHIVFNAVFLLVTFLADNKIELNFKLDEDTEVSLTTNSIFSLPSISNIVINEDSVYFEGTLTELLIWISPEKRQYLMVDNGLGVIHHTLKATSKTGTINRDNLRDALVERLPINIDTTEVNAYCLMFDEQFDGNVPNPNRDNLKSHSLSSIAYMIRTNHKLPVLVCDTLEKQDKLVQIDTDFYFIKSESRLKKYLRDRGVLINSETNKQMKRIEFLDKY
jgi:hypothetical protein